MIKFFQKLKAKKGFTLVELIVVIAIIGVLAAILVPTMLGYVTSSRVTSANSTAASLKNNVDTFLTNADTAGYGMKLSTNAKATLSINVDNAGVWTVNLGAGASVFGTSAGEGLSAFKGDASGIHWTATGTASADATKTTAGNNATALLAVELKNLFPDIKSSAMMVYLEGGKAKYCWYTADVATTGEVTNKPGVTAFKNEKYTWDGNTAGVSADGFIMGTAPALPLGTS